MMSPTNNEPTKVGEPNSEPTSADMLEVAPESDLEDEVIDHLIAWGSLLKAAAIPFSGEPSSSSSTLAVDFEKPMFMELTQDQFFYAPLGDGPRKVLDIGTGRGTWAADIGKNFPSSNVTGIDLFPTTVKDVPTNVSFLIRDAKQEWDFGSGFYLVHFRNVFGFVEDPDTVLQHARTHMKPGGWIELQEIHHNSPRSDDSSMGEADTLISFREALSMIEMTNRVVNIGKYLERVGFVDIHCVVKKLPIGPWAKGERLQRAGLYMKLALVQFITTEPEMLGVSKDRADAWVREMTGTLDKRECHRYFKVFFWYARAPGA